MMLRRLPILQVLLSCFNRFQLIVLLLALLFTVNGAILVSNLIETRYKASKETALKTILNGTQEAMNLWAREHLLSAQNFAEHEVVIKNTQALLKKRLAKDEILTSNALGELRKFFSNQLESGQYRGFFIVAPDNLNLASARDTNIAHSSLLTAQPDILARLWSGSATFSRVMTSDVHLDDSGGKLKKTLFVGSTIRNEEGDTIALLLMRIDPYQTLFPILVSGRLGSSGETYAVDNSGILLTPSRFNDAITQISALRSSLSALRIADPGVDLTQQRTEVPLQEWPLTHMAAQVTQKKSGSDLDGYRDYRGIPVVGAWSWNPTLNMGVTSEQDVGEAYETLYFIQWMIALGTALVVVTLLLVFWALVYGQKRTQRVEQKLSAIVSTAMNGIVTTNSLGKIQSANPAAERLFGYEEGGLIDKDLRTLVPDVMPDNRRKNFNGVLQRPAQQKSRREVEAHRADGTLFPIQISLATLELDDGLQFAAIIEDITEAKNFEHQLKEEKEFTLKIINALQANIAVLDMNGTIVMSNHAWERFISESGEVCDGASLGRNYLDVATVDQRYALGIKQKLYAVLDHELDHFSEAYPFYSQGELCWLETRLSKFSYQGNDTLVISHMDITQQTLYEQRLKEINAELRTMSLVAQNTDNAVVVTDAEGKVTWVNQGFTNISGYPLPEVQGRMFATLLNGPSTDPEMVNKIVEHIAQGIKVDGEILKYSKAGQPHWLQFEMVPVLDESKAVVQFVALEQDVTERKRMLAELQDERDKLQQLNEVLAVTGQALNRTGIAEFWVDAQNGRVIRASQQVCDYLGYTKQQMQQLSVGDFDEQYQHEEFTQTVAELKRVGWKRFESVHLTRGGDTVPVEITAMYHENEETGAKYIVAFTTDITQRKENEAELILSRKAAEDANRAKSTFLATMSHEIRTPLNGIVATIDLLEHEVMSPSQQGLVHTALDSAVMLQRVIDDILDFSKIEAGRLELEQIPLSLEKLLESLAANMRIQAARNNTELLIFCDPSMPEMLGDPVRIKQVMYNLVGNAIKFSKKDAGEKGKVKVFIELEERREHEASFKIIVRDNGIGISEEVQQRLFNPFIQADQTITRQFGGTGLGLVITRRLVEMMGGEINVSSALGRGAEFTIHLSMPITDEPQLSRILSGVEISLIKGNNTDVERIITCYLESAGASVEHRSVDELLTRLQRPVDNSASEHVIVLDSQNSTTRIDELNRVLLHEAPDFPANYLLISRGNCRSAKIDTCSGLTIDLDAMRRETLLNAVAVAVDRQSLVIEDEQQPVAGIDSSKKVSREQAIEQGRLILLVDDNAINRKVIGQQLTALGYGYDLAEDGMQALTMWQNGAYNLILTDCHMPVMDGYELTRQIREKEAEGQSLPIIAITADALKGTANKCYTAGMNAYLTKPMQLESLQAELERWLVEAKSSVVVEANEPHATVTPHTSNGETAIDPTTLAQLLGSDDTVMLKGFYQDFLSSSAETLNELKHAYAAKDGSTISQLGHKLKSSARTVGANALADCCLALEIHGKEGVDSRIDGLMQQLLDLFEQVQQWINEYD